MTDLSAYMAESIRGIMKSAYLNVLSNPREARFVTRMQRTFTTSERRRKATQESAGVEVPPFLIASIATACNLQCKALQSPLFQRIRSARALGWEHTGGCTLYEHRNEVEAMLTA